MLTRLRRPSIVKQLGLTLLLVVFQIYLGHSALSGQYGVEGRWRMQGEISDLKVESARIQAEIDSYKHRIALFDSKKLDPDILTERARALLSMSHKDDRIVLMPKG
jgi:cell division protein FtsB